MKTANTFTAIAVMLGSLSITDKVTALVGIVALVGSIVVNYQAYKKNKVEKELAKRRLEEEIRNGYEK